jgi:hypothetical protein
MRHIGQLIGIFMLLGGGLLSTNAQNTAASDNPYTTIIDRNIFSLVPIPVAPPPDTKPPEPPAKITPNGIMSIFGQLQALFKVASPTKPGQPAQDKSYTLSVGERQDDITVTKIDEIARIITFDNHGVVQELSLTTAAVPVSAPGFVRPPGAGPANRFGGRFAQGGSLGNPALGNNPNASAPPNINGNIGGNNSSQSAAENLSPEMQTLLIEKNYIDAKSRNDPSAPLFPPTVLRGQSDADPGVNGPMP